MMSRDEVLGAMADAVRVLKALKKSSLNVGGVTADNLERARDVVEYLFDNAMPDRDHEAPGPSHHMKESFNAALEKQ